MKVPKHFVQLQKLERPCSFMSLANCLEEELRKDDQRAYGIVHSADSLLNKILTNVRNTPLGNLKHDGDLTFLEWSKFGSAQKWYKNTWISPSACTSLHDVT